MFRIGCLGCKRAVPYVDELMTCLGEEFVAFRDLEGSHRVSWVWFG